MKINELVGEFGIWTSNEEHEVLHRITSPSMLESFGLRDQTIINQLIRKSLLIKVHSNNGTYVYPNR
jgi:hypothetical protein